jgi:dTDP-4-dehydrorhamnose 3,5-epimerase
MNFKRGEIEGVIINELPKYTDERGYLIETFQEDTFPSRIKPVMNYISFTKSGIARGPHEHREQTDIFYFIGPGNFRIKLWDNRQNSSTYGNFMEMIGG